MPLETSEHRGSLAWKVIASVFIVAPLAVVLFGLSALAGGFMGLVGSMGSGLLPAGALFLGLAGLAAWYLYSLIASLWLDRCGASIILGLIAGLIMLSIGVFAIADDAIASNSSHNTWPTKNHVETYGLGFICLAGWALTLFLICRTAFSKSAAHPSLRRPP